ncbi:intracellular serine protease [Gracilibacillus boraciitolerans JCM 21714]|uniref:Intracellular serine protease n=1 Tax=Gracilibacillus boraciitolerans JCM 21714 TaxID=1298598 RepID=W4VNP2_9BACI|nr:S8 family peptidase [Gracilibacillus boraciitolerans]GAE94985.1 intracellular serine protease [Gracilibacillus boraciitolerans JCM 21714]
MAQIKLIPYKIEETVDTASEIPEGIAMIKASEKWEKGYRGNGSVVAVIDTGCDQTHPDLEDRIIGGKNFTTENYGLPYDFSDENGHGTHVAGTIAANLNGEGVVGVAPEAKLLILKAFDKNGNGKLETIIQSIQYAMQWRGSQNERVRVISMSCGTTQNDKRLHQVIRQAVQNNILIVCAAGNNGGDGEESTNERNYPGYFKEVLQVGGAVDNNGRLAAFSNTNDEIDLVAPGVKIKSTYLGNKYALMSGTSMATPHVTGAAAVIIEQMELAFNRRLTEPEIYAQLVKSTIPLKYSKRMEGNGLIMLGERAFSPAQKESSLQGKVYIIPEASL